MVDKNKTVICCLLATSAIMLSEKKKRKRKMWSKKWYFKRNISCDAYLLNELLETDVPWEDANVVSAGKLRKLWEFSEWTAQFSVWRTTGKDSSVAWALACQNCAIYSIFPAGLTSHSKIAQFNWECIGRLKQVRIWIGVTEKIKWEFCWHIIRNCDKTSGPSAISWNKCPPH
jgi:hypothetical protein